MALEPQRLVDIVRVRLHEVQLVPIEPVRHLFKLLFVDSIRKRIAGLTLFAEVFPLVAVRFIRTGPQQFLNFDRLGITV